MRPSIPKSSLVPLTQTFLDATLIENAGKGRQHEYASVVGPTGSLNPVDAPLTKLTGINASLRPRLRRRQIAEQIRQTKDTAGGVEGRLLRCLRLHKV